VVEEMANKDPVSQKVYASFDSFRRQAMENTRVSEDGYSRARALAFG
jgi:TRAP-type mannitol/chloroaromatic compound transport system substrate-binding protein